MSETLGVTLRNFGLSDEQAGKLTVLQEAGRKLDFVYHHTDDGRDPQHTADQFDEFHNRLAVFSAEGAVPQQFAAALWDHLAPRFVGWRPGFIEGVEARNLGDVLTWLDQAIDTKLGRHIPPEVREASQEVRVRFDDLLFAYEAGTWRDSRTSGEVRDTLAFMALLDEKIRNVLYGDTRIVDLRQMVLHGSVEQTIGRDLAAEIQAESQGYRANLASISDVVDRLRAAGIDVQTGPEQDAVRVMVGSSTLANIRADLSEFRLGIERRYDSVDPDSYATRLEVRGELRFVSAFEHAVSRISVSGIIDLREVAINYGYDAEGAATDRSAGVEYVHAVERARRLYDSNISTISPFIERLAEIGVTVRTGFRAVAEDMLDSVRSYGQAELNRLLDTNRLRAIVRNIDRYVSEMRSSTSLDAKNYWLRVAGRGPGTALGPSRSLGQTTQRGRSI